MPRRLGVDSPIGRGGQPQTFTDDVMDLVGDLPCLTLMKARALTVTVEPGRDEALTRSVWRNGACLSILTRVAGRA
jgi:hypothetical protein